MTYARKQLPKYCQQFISGWSQDVFNMRLCNIDHYPKSSSLPMGSMFLPCNISMAASGLSNRKTMIAPSFISLRHSSSLIRCEKPYMYSIFSPDSSITSRISAKPPGRCPTIRATTSDTRTMTPLVSNTSLARSQSLTKIRNIPNCSVSARAIVSMLIPLSASVRQAVRTLPGLFSKNRESCLSFILHRLRYGLTASHVF